MDKFSLQNLHSSQEEVEDPTVSEEEETQDQEETIRTLIPEDVTQSCINQTLRDRKEDRESRKFKTYVNFQEVDEDGHEQEEDDAYAYDDDEITSDSEAFIITIFQMTFMSHVRGTLWKLRVAVYGLGEAGKEWYETIFIWLISTGMVRSDTDPAFFYYVKNGKLTGMLALHGDDALYGGNNEFYKDVIKLMKAKFKLERRMEDEYRVLDWNVEQDQGNIYVSQEDYVKNRLEWLKIEQAGLHKATTKLTEDNKAKLRQLIGRIRWVSDQS